MTIRFLIAGLAVMALSGCATTAQGPSPVNQLQNQVVDLEKRMEDQEKDMVDLQYEVKELAGKVDAQSTVEIEESSVPAVPVRTPVMKAPVVDAEGIVKVSASPFDVQTALKNAGFYDGKVDGKIGPRTKSAVMEFQKQHGLKADGVIGQKTWTELKTYLGQ